MKLLILLFTAWLAGQSACAQQIRLSLNNAPFRQLLKSIEQQTDYSFIYTKDQIQRLPAVTLTVTNKDLFEILNDQLRKQPVGYTVDNHFIIFYTKPSAVSDTMRTVSGRVINRPGEALAGVTVQVKNEQAIAITDQQGHFSLSYLSHNGLLQISGAELTTTLVTINDRDYMEIRMDERVKELDETIIMAYGKTTRRFNTGNISKVSTGELENQSTGNLLSALQGRVPGLLITASSGAPGASFIAQVRGQNSVNPNPLINNGIGPIDNPLIVVNGVPFAPQNNNVNQLPSLASPGELEIYRNPYGGISPFNSIDPADIESVEVLKDADMTAIYGSRAANGIILITTRQPKPGNINLLLDLSTGINIATSRPSMLSTREYLDLRKKAFVMDDIQPGMDPGEINYAPDLLIFDSTKYTDWHKYFFQDAAPVTSIHTRVSGGTGRLNFISGMGYRQESYLLKGDFHNKLFSLNNSIAYHSFDNRFKLEGTIYYTQGINHSISSPLLLQAINLPPNYPDLQDERGQLNWQYGGIELVDNPAGELRQPYVIRTTNLITSFILNREIFTGMTLKLHAGYSNFQSKESSLMPASAAHPLERMNSYARYSKKNFKTILAEPQFEYKKTSPYTTITILAGATIQQNTLYLSNRKGSEYQTDEHLGSIDAAGLVENRTAFDKHQYQSFFGRISLLQTEKYLLNLAGRRERSDRLSNEKEWGNFASIAGGWIFSEEKFIRQSLPFINFGKLRCSYGNTGNDNTGYDHQLHAWAAIPTYAGNEALIPSDLADAGFSWSVTTKLETGLELAMLKDKISIDISRYRHRSTDQLISQLSPSQSGVSRYISNFPLVVQNKGWEIMIGVTNAPSKNINWRSNINITIPKNKLRSFPGIENSAYAHLYFPGQSLSVVRLTKYTGVDDQTGLYKFDHGAYTFINAYPKFYGGLRNTVSYKNFEMEFFLEFRKQHGVNYLQQINHYAPGMPYNLPQVMQGYWQHPGERATLQRLTAVEVSPAYAGALMLALSDAAYEDASYMRFRTFSLSYSPAEKNVRKKGLSKLKVYLHLQNIFTLTSFRLTDPELQSYYSYPLQRSVMAGLQVQL